MDPVRLRRLGYIALFVALSLGIVFVRMLPLDYKPAGMPPPDLILLLGFAWVLRRPDYVPVLLFAAILLLLDFLFLRPPGVEAALGVAGLEFLRGRMQLLREQTFLIEWITVAVLLILTFLTERLLLGVTFVAQVPVEEAFVLLIVNVFSYPAVVLSSALGFGVVRVMPGDRPSEALP